MTPARRQLGAWRQEDGGYCFRLWAPAADRVELLLDGEIVAMAPEDDGCHAVSCACAPGTRYRFRIDGTLSVPDPASRWQPEGLKGASAVPDEDAYAWQTTGGAGRPWAEAVLYEVHVGAVGGYAALQAQLPALAAMGITALQLMPLATFAGTRNWGYDGVLPYAPAWVYGTPDELKALVDAAHALRMMVLLDVVFNHFGPEGNHLAAYAPQFFREDVRTPWGASIDFRQPWVQRFFIDNALMWLREYRFDGLRLDAVHAIHPQTFLVTLREAIHADGPAHAVDLVVENENNAASLLGEGYTAQWNDDFHNALHVLLTGETESYYADFAGEPAARLARVLAEGFAWQGEVNRHGNRRGEPSAGLSPDHFVVFAQNHDQIGNRAFGDRLQGSVAPARLRVAHALTALTPMVPLFFMGEPWGASEPFLFFTDFEPPLDQAVRDGRRKEFSQLKAFADPGSRDKIPDPNAVDTFLASRCPLPSPAALAGNPWLEDFTTFLALRRRYLVGGAGQARSLGGTVLAERAIAAGWALPDGEWWLAFNLGETPVATTLPAGETVLQLGNLDDQGRLAPASLVACWVAR
ncbi:malto-oligosyltrehalose trehalohydrolase [Stenotrophomonas nematodicola]|uniref:Malto-oligosyltrehalose trehalohydrolase n=1 Tax=Stenotrophomonas nematodicola TaxID=2656746 RepID=A0ABW7CXN2_9GAMM